MSKTENLITKINSNIFFQEFTFSKNTFYSKELVDKQEIELADNIVWIDDLLFIYQIKDRGEIKYSSDETEIKWFENKILNIAVKQIKDTVKYLSDLPKIIIENERGYKINIAKSDISEMNKIIIYNPNAKLPNKKRFQKFYYSKKVGLIHLFHIEDYYWICKYLITPAEIDEYLKFREELYLIHKDQLDEYPEQYVLGHFLATPDSSEIKPEYINFLTEFKQDHSNAEILAILDLFRNNTILAKRNDDYFYVVKEIAKLNRGEFQEFIKRFFLIFDKCEEELTMPYRVVFPRTGCGFVFIALNVKYSQHWKKALTNFTLAHKYDQKLEKCIGILIYRISKTKKDYEIFWNYARFDWAYDDKMEKILKDNFPFREVKLKMEPRYNFGKNG